MLVQCSKCKTKYNIPPDRVDDDSILKVRCNNCGHVFGVRRKKKPEPQQQSLPPFAEPTTAPIEESAPVTEEPTPAPEPEPPDEVTREAEGTVGEEEAKDFDLSFDDFNLDDLAATPAPAASEEQSEAVAGESAHAEPQEDLPTESEEPIDAGLDLDLLAESALPPAEEAPEPSVEPEPEDALGDLSFDDFDLSAMSVDPPADPAPDVEEKPRDVGAATYDRFAEMRKPESEVPDLGDLDLSDFNAMSEELPEESKSAQAKEEPTKPALSAEDFAKGLQELDLSSFEEKEDDGLEKVSTEDLVSTAPGAKVKKPEKIKKPKKPRKPLPWGMIAIVSVLAASVAYLAFNIVYKPDSAFVLVNPWALKKIMARSDGQKRFEVVGAPEGGYVDRDDKKRIFVVTGKIENKTGTPVSAIRVRADLYGKSGPSIDFREAYCGNLLPRDEILGLPLEKVLEAGERLVGEGFANVDVAPGARVACMVVFPSPPTGVEKFSMEAIAPAVEAEKKK